MNRYRDGDTIAAIASPPGPSACALLRLSGGDAFRLVRDHFEPADACAAGFLSPSPSGRGAWRGRWRLRWSAEVGAAGSASWIPALLYVCPGPKSYTREDVAELHLPGSPAVTAAAMRTLVAAGARPAAGGEFAWRAFVHGRIGPREAAALPVLMASADEDERRQALRRVAHGAPEDAELVACREALWTASARVEAALDFPEHPSDSGHEPGGGKGFPDDGAGEAFPAAWRAVAERLEALARRTASAAASGGGLPRVRLAGLSNAGKSSLLNALLGREAALSSPERSTTRDRLALTAEWDGFRAVVEDLPGFDPETARGRSVAPGERLAALLAGGEAARGRTALVMVVDAARAPDGEFAALRTVLSGRRVVAALHKADIPADAAWEDPAVWDGLTVAATVATSARDGRGLEALRRALRAELGGDAPDGAGAAWSATEWERESWTRAAEECRWAASEWEAGFGELSAERLRQARGWLSGGWGVGDVDAEAMLERIFGGLCVGK